MARLGDGLRMTVRRLALMFRRSRLDDELRDEVALHIELRRQALVDRGMDPRDAEIEARRMFGNATAIREETREMWGFPSIDTLWQDVRYGARLLRRSPTVTIASVASLAIGIGASAAVFSLADLMLFRRLAVRAPEQLVVFRWRSGPAYPFSSLSGTSWSNDGAVGSTSFSLEALRRAQPQIGDVADLFGFADLDRVNLSVNGVAELGEATAVSGNYFSALGVSPALGRALVDSDDRIDTTPPAVISDGLWKRRFDGSPDAIGRALIINGSPFTVVGVTPASFHGAGQVASSPDVYVPIAAKRQVVREEDDPSDPNYWWVLMMARLKAGSDSETARGRLDLIVKRTVQTARPAMAAKDLPTVEAVDGSGGQVEVRTGMREPLQMMSVVVGIVLLVACANVANLLLARGRARVRELSVRIALGAPRRRIVRQLLTEGVLLAALGSALGLLAARWIAGALLPALSEGPDPVTITAGLSLRLVGFVAALASACVAIFALVPALRATDMSLVAGLREAGRGSATGLRRRGLSATLVVSQITLSMVLVATALLLVRSVRQLREVDLGFDASHLLTFKVDPTLNGYKDARVFEIYSSILDRLRATPGVAAATVSRHTLLSNSSSITEAVRLDEPLVDRASAESAAFRSTHRTWRLAVDPQFFSTMGIRVERGRALDDRDNATSQRVAVINHLLARQLFNTDDAIGRRFRTEMTAGGPEYEVVGICADARYTSLRRPKPPTMYVPYIQEGAGSMTFEVRTAGDPSALVAVARDVIRSVDRNVPMFRVQSQEQQIAASLQRERLFARLAAWLGIVAVMLSAIGLYALLAYTVTLRTGEIGIRMALGAAGADVRWMIVRQSLLVAGFGLVFGIVASAIGTDMLKALLFNVAPRDPTSFVLSAVIMLAVSVVAGAIPAHRASRVDPLVALRSE
jgi:predicted permease